MIPNPHHYNPLPPPRRLSLSLNALDWILSDLEASKVILAIEHFHLATGLDIPTSKKWIKRIQLASVKPEM